MFDNNHRRFDGGHSRLSTSTPKQLSPLSIRTPPSAQIIFRHSSLQMAQNKTPEQSPLLTVVESRVPTRKSSTIKQQRDNPIEAETTSIRQSLMLSESYHNAPKQQVRWSFFQRTANSLFHLLPPRHQIASSTQFQNREGRSREIPLFGKARDHSCSRCRRGRGSRRGNR